DRLQLNELTDICTKLSDRVLSLEQTKTNQAAEIEKLKKRVKKLEGKKKKKKRTHGKKKKKKRTHGLKRLYKVGLSARVESDEECLDAQEDASKQGRIAEIDDNEDLFLIDETAQDQGRIKDQDLFRVHDLDGDEVFVDVTTAENVEQEATVAESVEGIAVATTLQISKDELTLAQTLMEIKAAKPKAKGVTIQEPSEFKTTSPPQPSQPPWVLEGERRSIALRVKKPKRGAMRQKRTPLIGEAHTLYKTILTLLETIIHIYKRIKKIFNNNNNHSFSKFIKFLPPVSTSSGLRAKNMSIGPLCLGFLGRPLLVPSPEPLPLFIDVTTKTSSSSSLSSSTSFILGSN
nr:hypothetical protein [Tanacetum cinerariifolium]